jgi:hypothetical protein
VGDKMCVHDGRQLLKRSLEVLGISDQVSDDSGESPSAQERIRWMITEIIAQRIIFGLQVDLELAEHYLMRPTEAIKTDRLARIHIKEIPSDSCDEPAGETNDAAFIELLKRLHADVIRVIAAKLLEGQRFVDMSPCRPEFVSELADFQAHLTKLVADAGAPILPLSLASQAHAASSGTLSG